MRKLSGSLVVMLLALSAACAGEQGEPPPGDQAGQAGAASQLATGGAGAAGAGAGVGAAGVGIGTAGVGSTAGVGPLGAGIGPGGVGGASAAGVGGTVGAGGVGGLAGSGAGGVGLGAGTGGSGGAAGGAGTTPIAGTGAGTGGVAGASAGGGSGGAGPSTGGTGPSNGGNTFIRGPDPTVQSATAEGPYTVASYSSGFAVGPSFPAGTVWYPEDADPPFAAIAIIPGFVSPRVLIEGWGPFLASHGIVVFTIDTNAVTDQPSARSAALLNALDSLAAENTRAGSPLNGKLDNDFQAVGGHSMGGGGTLITANTTPRLKAAVPMCPWSPGARFSSNQVPTLIFASAGDPLAGGQSQGFYSSIPSGTPKMLFEWGAADHFMANAPTGAAGQAGRFALSWLKVFLEGDERYRQFLEQPCEGCTDFDTNL